MKRRLELVMAAALGAGIALLLAFGVLGRGTAPQAPLGVGEAGAPRASAADVAIEELTAALQAEALARENLEAEVALMRTVIEQSSLGFGNAGEDPGERVALASTPPEARKRGPFGDFDGEALGKEGLDREQVARVKSAWERNQLAQLELADLATREGWRGQARYRREMQGLRTELRAELGDEGYDQMLYATGVPNRIVVQRVFSDSAASSAGLRAGDHVLSYDGQRIRNSGELRALTLLGQRGELVRIQIFRDGRQQSLSVPRGPVGINTRMESHPPLSRD